MSASGQAALSDKQGIARDVFRGTGGVITKTDSALTGNQMRNPPSGCPIIFFAIFAAFAVSMTACQSLKRDGTAIDRTYRNRVDHFSLNLGATFSPVPSLGLTGTWFYRLPELPKPSSK